MGGLNKGSFKSTHQNILLIPILGFFWHTPGHCILLILFFTPFTLQMPNTTLKKPYPVLQHNTQLSFLIQNHFWFAHAHAHAHAQSLQAESHHQTPNSPIKGTINVRTDGPLFLRSAYTIKASNIRWLLFLKLSSLVTIRRFLFAKFFINFLKVLPFLLNKTHHQTTLPQLHLYTCAIHFCFNSTQEFNWYSYT